MSTVVRSIELLLRKHWLWLLANLGAAWPFLWLVWDIGQGNLSANPIADITTRTGKPAIILLMLSLACTPVNILTGYSKVLTLRKSLGLFAFFYAILHFLVFVGLDYGFDLQFILSDTLLEKRYILVGLTALLLLIPLALTSTKGWMKRLGRNWKRLHQVVYLIGILAVAHFLWLVKASRLYEPLIYALILSFLLVVRLPPVRKFFVNLRRRKPAARTNPAERKSRPVATPST
jgi:sulfoxide reductase heme-binding subunit YedZ